MSSDPHQGLQAFFDGELGTAEAEGFRLHLGQCEQCQRGLNDLMQLEAVALDAKDVLPLPLAAAPARSWRRFWPLIGLATAAGLASIAFVQRGAAGLAKLEGPRRIEARVGWAPGDEYRPYDTMRGGAVASSVPLATLAALESRGDQQALAGALLLGGDAARARTLLEALPANQPGVLADLAAVALVQGRPEDALELAQRAIDLEPKHARALWNRALASRELGLTAVAAKGFAEAAALAEPGWSAEAAERQRALAETSKAAIEKFQRVLDAAGQMALDQRPMPAELVTAAPTVARHYLAYALRIATSAEQVNGLKPVATQLDALFGEGSRALASVERAAQQKPEARATLARGFRALVVDYLRSMKTWGMAPQVPEAERGFTGEEAERFTALVTKEGSADDLVLALPTLQLLPERLEVFAHAAEQLGDPWVVFAATTERAKHAAELGDGAAAEQLLAEVIEKAPKVAPLRAMQAREELIWQLLSQHRAAEAQLQAFAALPLARGQGELNAESRVLSMLGDAARLRINWGLARAALEERALTLRTCESKIYLEESTATMHLYTLDAAAMRRALQRAATCGDPLSTVGLLAYADLSRLSGLPADRAGFAEALQRSRASGALSPSDLVLAMHAEGRLLIDVDPVAGEAKLREAMKAARSNAEGDAVSTKVIPYGFGLLRSAAGKQRDFEKMFALTSEELGRPLPAGCALVVDVEDDRVAVAVRDAKGDVSGEFVRAPTDRPHLDWLSSEEISAVVKPVVKRGAASCADQSMGVYTGMPLNGRSGWLPDDLAWSFASGFAPRAVQPGPRLVVSDVGAPPELKLPRLAARTRDAAGLAIDRSLTGAEATPDRVIAAMRDAAYIELDAHGLVNPASEDAAMVVLARGPTGYALTASTVKTLQLQKSPVVLLGACRAATVAPYLHEQWSLPHAFLEAGARAVVASPEDLPDADAREFFANLARRIARGENVSVALRDERVKWLKQGRAKWVREVLVFE